MFNPTAKIWTWVSGSRAANTLGVYGTQGVASTSNVPGSRIQAVSWIDKSGNFWLFGGSGIGSPLAVGLLNDLWMFNPTAKIWTWVSGSSAVNTLGVYGTMGTPTASNVPGARDSSVGWTDSSGNLWLFGGYGNDSTSTQGDLNDLWEFSPTTKEWTWVSGSNTVGSGPAVYGTKGVAAASNTPGARGSSVSWIDGSGNLWLFGGIPGFLGIYSFESNLNDLWEFSPTNKEWTWVSGANTIPAGSYGQSGVYGTQGVAAASNVPGARDSAVSWVDPSGNLWLFGGLGYDSTGALVDLNDLWRYQP
jgi:N-acetylneuraminic acid mutarotase